MTRRTPTEAGAAETPLHFGERYSGFYRGVIRAIRLKGLPILAEIEATQQRFERVADEFQMFDGVSPRSEPLRDLAQALQHHRVAPENLADAQAVNPYDTIENSKYELAVDDRRRAVADAEARLNAYDADAADWVNRRGKWADR